MTPRDIIAEAWAITKREKSLRRWGVFSSFLETLLSLKLMSYQAYFLYAYVVSGEQVGFFDDVYWLYAHVPPWAFFTIVGSFVVLVVVEWIVPHLALGAIIGLSAKAHNGEATKGGLVLALYNFFPIFVAHEFFVFGSTSLLITFISLVLRYMGGNITIPVIAVAVAVWLFTNVLHFFASFAPAAIVVQKKGVFDAMGQSYKLIISHLGHVMFLLVLLLVITLRVAVNAAVVLLIPAVILGFGLFLAHVLSAVIAYSIAGIVGVLLLGLAAYFFGYLHVFKEAVWTITYIELKKHKDLDVIES